MAHSLSAVLVIPLQPQSDKNNRGDTDAADDQQGITNLALAAVFSADGYGYHVADKTYSCND